MRRVRVNACVRAREGWCVCCVCAVMHMSARASQPTNLLLLLPPAASATRLGPGACTEVECDAWLPRCRLLELVQIQLSVL